MIEIIQGNKEANGAGKMCVSLATLTDLQKQLIANLKLDKTYEMEIKTKRCHEKRN